MKERKCRRKSLDGYDEREREKENNLKELVKTRTFWEAMTQDRAMWNKDKEGIFEECEERTNSETVLSVDRKTVKMKEREYP